jgi:SAM-dependent methyltransferase
MEREWTGAASVGAPGRLSSSSDTGYGGLMSNETQTTTEYTWKGRTGPFTVSLTPGVFRPTSTSVTLAEAMEIHDGDVVVDVGCGSGVLAFVAARLKAAKAYGCDLSSEAVKAARENARRLGVSAVTEFRAGNLLEPVRDIRADVIIGDVSGIPDPIALATGWFPDGIGGGPTGAELPVAMLEGVQHCLKPGGRLYLPTGTIQDESTVLETARRLFGAENVKKLIERQFPLPGSILESDKVARLISDGLVDLKRKGLLWRLAVWSCRQA